MQFFSRDTPSLGEATDFERFLNVSQEGFVYPEKAVYNKFQSSTDKRGDTHYRQQIG